MIFNVYYSTRHRTTPAIYAICKFSDLLYRTCNELDQGIIDANISILLETA